MIPVFSRCLMMLVFVSFLSGIGLQSAWAKKQPPPRAFGPEIFRELDYGLYWFGPDGQHQKAVAHEPNAYFNPYAPTVIYIHGWEVGETRRQYREIFDYGFIGGPRENLANAWLSQGWNVGVFYWNQFSDEISPAMAEAKVWTHRSLSRMRWRDLEGSLHEGPDKSATDLFVESYASAMQDYQGPHIRIVGHSFGSQMAIVGSRKILDAIQQQTLPPHLLPHRLALLDPAYMGGQRAFLGNKTTSQAAYAHAQALIAEDVVMETYRTSTLMWFTPITDMAMPLLSMTAYADVPTSYIAPWDFQKKHIASIWHYFWSFQFDSPTVLWSHAQGLSASTPDERVRQMMASPLRVVQVKGKFSKTPQDDVMMFWPK